MMRIKLYAVGKKGPTCVGIIRMKGCTVREKLMRVNCQGFTNQQLAFVAIATLSFTSVLRQSEGAERGSESFAAPVPAQTKGGLKPKPHRSHPLHACDKEPETGPGGP